MTSSTMGRAADFLYVAGVIFRTLQGTLNAAGAAFADIVMLDSFHVWDSPNFGGDKAAHSRVFAEVKDEFLTPPYPAWTAIGATALMTGGSVEIQLIACCPNGC